MNEEEIIEKLRSILVKKLNDLLKSLISSYKKDKKSITDIIGEQQGESLEEKISSIIKKLKKPQYTKKVSSFLKNSGYEVELENNTYYIRYKTQDQETKIEMPKDIKELYEQLELLKGDTLEESIISVIQGLKNPKYTKSKSKLRYLNKLGYSIVFEDDKYYIIYKRDEEELKLEMPKDIKDIKELCEQLELLSGNTQNDYGNGSLKNIITNIIVNMYLNEDIRKIDKDVVQAIDNEIDIEPYTIVVDTNGAIGVDIEDKRYYLPIRVSTKILQLGALQDEQDLIQHSNKELGDIINQLLTRKDDSFSIEYELIALLKKRKDRISFIDGRYYIEDSESGTSVELSLEQNNTITELENSIFNRIRDSYEKPDNNKNIDFRSYDALLKLIELGFKLERDETSNKIIITSVTGREFTKEQSDFIDLDFSKLPFIKEKPKSKRSELTKENLERVLKLSRNIDTKTVELMQKLANVKEMTNADVEAQTNYIKDVFLNRTCSIIAIDRKYYIIGQDFQIPLTDEQYEFLSKLEENLFNTIYNSEKDSDVDGEKSVVQDVNGYNTLIQMMELGYIFNMITDEENNIVDDRVLITSPTGKILIRSINDFENIKMGEIHWDVQEDNKTNYFKLQTLKNYKELAEYINNKIYPAIETAEKHLDGNGDNLQIELSIKYLLEALNPNDGDKLTSYVNGVYVVVSEKNEIAISLDKKLSEKIDRLTKKYIEILYQNNKTTSKKPSNEQGKSKENKIEDIRSYFSNGGIKIEDIENKISPVFDENGERISDDINAQKTIIQLMELGYKFTEKDGKIKITTPFDRVFYVSSEEYNKKGLPHTQSMFDLIEEFRKSEKETKDYSTTNFYGFLKSKADLENKTKVLEGIRAKKRFNAGENKRDLNQFTREHIVKRIKEIQELKDNNEEYFEQLVNFFQEIKSYEDIAMKYNAEKDVYVVYNYETEAWCTLPDEQCKELKTYGAELAKHLLERKENKYGIETQRFSGMIQLLELGFVVKPLQVEDEIDMYIFDPFNTNTGKNRNSDKGDIDIDDTIDETFINHYKELLKIAECVNENLECFFKKMGEDDNYNNFPDFLQKIAHLENEEGDSICIDWVDFGNSKELCFVNPKSNQYIQLTDEQRRVLFRINKIFQNEDLYGIIEGKITGKTINKTDDKLDTDKNLIIPDNRTEKDRIIDSYKMYKVLMGWELDISVYEKGILRVGIKLPWNETVSLNPDCEALRSVALFTEDPINLNSIDPTRNDYEELKKLQFLFKQGGLTEKIDLFNEYYETCSLKGKPDEEIIRFLLERANVQYKIAHPIEALRESVNNVASVGRRAATNFRLKLATPELKNIGTSLQPTNPTKSIRTGFDTVVGRKPHPSIVEHFIKGSIEESAAPKKPGSSEKGVGIDD